MKSPFPGMDPYLEKHWGDVHTRLVTYASDQLQPRLPARLRACVQEQMATPIVLRELREPRTDRWIEIRDVASNDRVITVIEFLRPANQTKAGWKLYKRKFEECRKAGVSFVEIDLLRKGPRLHPHYCETDESYGERFAYQSTVWRSWGEDEGVAYSFNLRDKLKGILIPLRPTDRDVPLDLQALIDQAYRNGNYGDTLDYGRKPSPPFNRADAAWARKLMKTARKR